MASKTYKNNGIRSGSRSSKHWATREFQHSTSRETPREYHQRIIWQCAYRRQQPNWDYVPAELQDEMLELWWKAIDQIDPTFAAEYEARLNAMEVA